MPSERFGRNSFGNDFSVFALPGHQGKDLFRMLYFLPYITPSVTSAVVFQIIFSRRETSLANRIIGFLELVHKNGDLKLHHCSTC